jgi:hypothetical protein
VVRRRLLLWAFQIVELTLDTDNNVIERRVVPYPYQTREEAVTAIECIVSTFAEAGYEPAQRRRGRVPAILVAPEFFDLF